MNQGRAAQPVDTTDPTVCPKAISLDRPRDKEQKTAALLAPPKFREETSKKQGAEAHLQDAAWPSQVQHAMGVLNNCASTLLGGFVGKSGSAVDGGMVSCCPRCRRTGGRLWRRPRAAFFGRRFVEPLRFVVLSARLAIPCSGQNPKIRGSDDPEVIRDLIAIGVPFSGHLLAQKRQHRGFEIGECRMTLIVRDMPVHQAPTRRLIADWAKGTAQ